MSEKSFGWFLDRALVVLKVSAEELAQTFETTPQTILDWSKDKSIPEEMLQNQVIIKIGKLLAREAGTTTLLCGLRWAFQRFEARGVAVTNVRISPKFLPEIAKPNIRTPQEKELWGAQVLVDNSVEHVCLVGHDGSTMTILR